MNNNQQNPLTWNDCIEVRQAYLTAFEEAKSVLLNIGINAASTNQTQLKQRADNCLHQLAVLEDQVNKYMSDKVHLLTMDTPLTADQTPMAYAIHSYHTLAIGEIVKTMESFQ
ncbi:hypothetical protein CZP2022_180 [Vibrio phage C-ZP2022]|nr:hypothetical protein CZP2022_180 [Vibrio phage C-ZP2022]